MSAKRGFPKEVFAKRGVLKKKVSAKRGVHKQRCPLIEVSRKKCPSKVVFVKRGVR